jgi:hypothetical protein
MTDSSDPLLSDQVHEWRTFDLSRGQRLWFVAIASILLLVAFSLALSDTMVLRSDGVRPRPVITEFMASNGRTLADQDGAYSDWIEIHNESEIGLDLGGWYLTDNHDNLTKWRFPEVHLAAGDYLVVFASGKDRAVPGAELHTNFVLDRSGERLELVEPDGKKVAWSYAYADREQLRDISYGLDAARNERYLTLPTPGEANGAVPADLAPILSAVGHTPLSPTADEPLVVTAAVQASLAPVSAVTLCYRVMYGDEQAVPMVDDGTHGDGVARDGVYGAIIPAHAYRAGEMVRYAIAATDRDGRTSRLPFFHDPASSPQYFGTMVADPSVTSLLPTLYWFVEDPEAGETRQGTRASVFYGDLGGSGGAFYDNVFVRLRGISSRSWDKNSLKFDFNPGHYFQFAPDQDPVEEFNLNTTFSDHAYIRQTLAWETYRDAGIPYCISFPMRVQQNGTFYSVAIFVEQPDERYLERQGLDVEGALYKMKVGSALDVSPHTVEKQTRLDEDNGDLQALIEGIHLDGSARTAYLFDHVDIPAVLNYQAAATIIHDRDQGHNNYYLYHDTRGTGEWMFLPWDKDLTFGLNYNQGLDLVVTADDDPQSHPLNCYKHNNLIRALYETPITREMFLRRLRTLMDQLLQPPGTPPGERYYERRIDELYTQMQLDAALDAVRWPQTLAPPQTLAQAVHSLRVDYLDARRVHLYDTHGPGNGGIIPDAQPLTATVQFGDIGFAPRGDQECEYLTLMNANEYAVDISGWRIEGAIEYTFAPGVVIPSGKRLYVSPDTAAFRARASSPRGGEGRFVQGDYVGRLSNTAGVLRLIHADGRLVASKSFWGLSPSDRRLIAIELLCLAPLVLLVRALGSFVRG